MVSKNLRTNFLGAGKMQSQSYSLILICIILAPAICLSQEQTDTSSEAVLVQEANEPTISFPYVAQVTGNRVNIRSGPGTNYYSCCIANKNDRVIVVGRKFGWSQISPPEGSFSWISKQYINIEAENSQTGIVTGDNIRVYAGSDELQPMRSTREQLKLNQGDKVKLLGEEKEQYYKIAPPEGAYLWVFSQYIEPLGPVGHVAADVKPAIAEDSIVEKPQAAGEEENLQKFYDLQKLFDAQREKPIEEQEYSSIKKGLKEIADREDAPKAAKYAQFTLEQIERCELAQDIGKQMKLQDEKLQQAEQRIKEAHEAKKVKIVDLGKFAVIGRFQTSIVYGAAEKIAYYRILDENDATICYAVPEGLSEDIKLTDFIGKKVGLIGTIEPHKETGSALVKFSEITKLN
jgi:hypothetical protein